VQRALGVPVNYTGGSARMSWIRLTYLVVGQAFTDSADAPRGTFITDLGNLLDQGIQVVIYHGYNPSKNNLLTLTETQIMCIHPPFSPRCVRL
jgi:hypothetical protein